MKFVYFLTLIVSIPAWSAPVPENLSAEERFAFYEKAGLGYAQALYQDPKVVEDENRATKVELLNIRIREKTIASTKALLTKTKEQKLRRDLLERLAILYSEQAEVYGHMTHKTDAQNGSWESSNANYKQLHKEYPKWRPDVVLFRIAENLDKLKKTNEAALIYAQLVRDYKNSSVKADALLALGNIYFDRRAFELAKSTYGAILTTDEQNLYAYAHYKMAWCHFNASNFNPAVNELELAIKESRRLQAQGDHRLGVEDEALSDLVLFFAEYGNPLEAKAYFAKIVGAEKAKEMRYDLARRLFEYGKHAVARVVVSDLLADQPNKEYTHKLYLILVSIAERVQDRQLGLSTAEKLTSWLKDQKLAQNNTARGETEEYLRLYSEKLHHEAETLKQKEVWADARKAYEIYLASFPNEAETPEVKFRYSVLLMNRKEPLLAYNTINEMILKIDGKHPRLKEALRLRIQAIEFLSKSEIKDIGAKDTLLAYDQFVKNFPKDELSAEASFKAAGIAKTIESPEQVSARYQAIVSAWPKANLAKNAATESMAVLVSAGRWESLKQNTLILSGVMQDAELQKKFVEANDLASVKITEDLEKNGKFLEAKKEYEKILAQSTTESMSLFALIHLAHLSEQSLHENQAAIAYLEKMQQKYPNSNEGRQATLELARLFTSIAEPKKAVNEYLAYSEISGGKYVGQALTNAGVMLEKLGDHAHAGEVFFKLNDILRKQRGSELEASHAFEAACNNTLLSSFSSRDKKVLRSIHDCARQLALKDDSTKAAWQARAAWALDQMAEGADWSILARRKMKDLAQNDQAYVAMAKLRVFSKELDSFKRIKFSKNNEKPTANITKKSDAMGQLETLAETILKIGTPKQALQAKNILQQAYLDFAETMENAAVPSKLKEAEKAELKKGFLGFAKDFRVKAEALSASPNAERKIASIPSEKSPAPDALLSLPSLSENELERLHAGTLQSSELASVYAKLAFSQYQKGNYGEAKYFSLEWQKHLPEQKLSSVEYSELNLSRLQKLLGEKLPERDPVSEEF